jgi:uncharacterized protein
VIALLGTTLVTSLVGSLHCAGMCGPFVGFYAGQDRDGRGLARHAAYNGGRLVVYTALGALAGAVGAVVDLAGRALEVQRVAAVLAGAVILTWGLLALLRALGVRVGQRAGRVGPLGPALVRLRTRPPVVRAAALGFLTAALPCGWLWAFVVAAAGTGSAAWGAALMFAFWLGTVPMLLGLGLGAQRLARTLGRRLPVVTAGALIVVGLAAMLTRAPMLDAAPDPEAPACHGD